MASQTQQQMKKNDVSWERRCKFEYLMSKIALMCYFKYNSAYLRKRIANGRDTRTYGHLAIELRGALTPF